MIYNLHDLFVTAIEGGITYWARVDFYHWSVPGKTGTVEQRADREHFTATITDMEADDGAIYTVDAALILKGLELLEAGTVTFGGAAWPKGRQVLGRIVAEQYDASDADMVVQAGLFGDVRYG